jgi:hypothetical protein
MIATLDPGSYTATATSLGGRQGITLLEVYDSIPTGASGSLRNVSLRARTGGGANVATLGFALVGNTAARLLVRGVGPTLSVFGISGSLQDPVLSLFRPQYPSLLATNAGWANDGSIAAAAKSSGAFALPANSHDAAMVVALNPGTYTVQLTSASSTTGEGLIEVYLLGQQ